MSTHTPSCPRVSRFYLVDGQPLDAYPAAKQVLIDAGFVIGYEIHPFCDSVDEGSACSFVASRAAEAIHGKLFNPGVDQSDTPGPAVEGRSLSVITGHRTS